MTSYDSHTYDDVDRLTYSDVTRVVADAAVLDALPGDTVVIRANGRGAQKNSGGSKWALVGARRPQLKSRELLADGPVRVVWCPAWVGGTATVVDIEPCGDAAADLDVVLHATHPAAGGTTRHWDADGDGFGTQAMVLEHPTTEDGDES